MKVEPLVLRDIPKDNVFSLQATLSALLPPGLVTLVTVAHDAGCPCENGSKPMVSCTCETVDVTLRAVNWEQVDLDEELNWSQISKSWIKEDHEKEI